jgi:hypothetical protein
MCVAGLALCQAFSVSTAAAAETIAIANHTATFVQVRENYPAAGQSTWYYSFTSGRKPAISHVTFALGCPGIMILDAGMWDGENMDKLMYKAGMPEPGTFPGAPKGDPTTGIVGLKFDLGFDPGRSRRGTGSTPGRCRAPRRAGARRWRRRRSATGCGWTRTRTGYRTTARQAWRA